MENFAVDTIRNIRKIARAQCRSDLLHFYALGARVKLVAVLRTNECDWPNYVSMSRAVPSRSASLSYAVCCEWAALRRRRMRRKEPPAAPTRDSGAWIAERRAARGLRHRGFSTTSTDRLERWHFGHILGASNFVCFEFTSEVTCIPLYRLSLDSR
jgi:hypothetical protein